jgi:hypothetical protein
LPTDFSFALGSSAQTPSPPDDLRLVNGKSPASLVDMIFLTQFWPAYPERKGNRKPAAIAFRKAVKGANARDILDGLAMYCTERDQADDDPKFTLHASTWLNREGWKDQLAERDRIEGIKQAIRESLAQPMEPAP